MGGRVSRYDELQKAKSKGIRVWSIAEYIRLSVEDGDDKVESNSIINQRALLNDFLKNNLELKLYDYYIDDGYSGTDFNRPRISEIIKRYESQKI